MPANYIYPASLPATGCYAAAMQASQAFEPRGRTVLNRGEIAGERFFVTAGGTYEPVDASTRCPKRIRASVEEGTLHLLQWTLPLPIRCGAAGPSSSWATAWGIEAVSTREVPPLPAAAEAAGWWMWPTSMIPSGSL